MDSNQNLRIGSMILSLGLSLALELVLTDKAQRKAA